MLPLIKHTIQITIIDDSHREECEAECGVGWSSPETTALASQRIKNRFGDKLQLAYLDLAKAEANHDALEWGLLMIDNRNYDVVIIGGGPAGLSAGIYAARARLSSLLIEKEIIGGQVLNTELVENYPGFLEGISGYDLTELMHQQATKFGLETLTPIWLSMETTSGIS